MRAAQIVAVITVALMWGCGIEWFPDDTTTNGGGFDNNSSGFNNHSTASQHNNFSSIFRNVSTAFQPVSDSTGTVTVKSVVAQESARTASDVEFTLYVDVTNAGSSAATVEAEIAGVALNGAAVLKTTQTTLVSANSRKFPGYSGMKVTLAQWNSIARWSVLKVTKK